MIWGTRDHAIEIDERDVADHVRLRDRQRYVGQEGPRNRDTYPTSPIDVLINHASRVIV